MKIACYIFSGLFIYGCVYDPPLKGKNIYFINQDSNYVFITDALNVSGYLERYDTVFINGTRHIMKKGNYLSKYSLWEDFLSQKEMDSYKTKSIKLKYRFIKDENLNFPKSIILNQKLYDSIELDINEILQNKLNYIVYYKDSIVKLHEYSLSHSK
jgi:hypothetical protein